MLAGCSLPKLEFTDQLYLIKNTIIDCLKSFIEEAGIISRLLYFLMVANHAMQPSNEQSLKQLFGLTINGEREQTPDLPERSGFVGGKP